MGYGSAIVPGTVGGGTKVIMTLPVQSNVLTYTGSAQSPTWIYNTDQLTITATAQTNAGTYTATATPKNNCRWFDGTTAAKTINWTIGRQKITAVPTQKNTTVVYSGSTITATFNNNPGTSKCSITNITGVNAGNYTAFFTPLSNYCWNDGNIGPIAVLWKINPKQVTPPTVTKTSKTYNGSILTPTITYPVSGDKKFVDLIGFDEVNAGDYEAYISLIDKTNYVWKTGSNAGTSSDIKVEWTINKIDESYSVPETYNLTKTTLNPQVFFIDSYKGDGEIKVVSSDTSVCTVQSHVTANSFTITPKKTGIATLTFSFINQTNYNAIESKTSTCYICIPQNLLRSCSSSAGMGTIKDIIDSLGRGDFANIAAPGDYLPITLNGTLLMRHASGTTDEESDLVFNNQTFNAILLGFNHNDKVEYVNSTYNDNDTTASVHTKPTYTWTSSNTTYTNNNPIIAHFAIGHVIQPDGTMIGIGLANSHVGVSSSYSTSLFGAHSSPTTSALETNNPKKYNGGVVASLMYREFNGETFDFDGAFLDAPSQNLLTKNLWVCLPTALKQYIVPLNKYTNRWGFTYDGYSEHTPSTNDVQPYKTNIWAMSEIEVFGNVWGGHPDYTIKIGSTTYHKEKQYDFYANGNLRIRYWYQDTTMPVSWWTRTMNNTSSSLPFHFICVSPAGGRNRNSNAYQHAWVPCFALMGVN